MTKQNQAIRSAFRQLPWWLRLVLSYAALLVVSALPLAGIALAIRSLVAPGDRSVIMLGCTSSLFSLPVGAIGGTWLRAEIRYALHDPDRPAVRRREREALEFVRRRHRQGPLP